MEQWKTFVLNQKMLDISIKLADLNRFVNQNYKDFNNYSERCLAKGIVDGLYDIYNKINDFKVVMSYDRFH